MDGEIGYEHYFLNYYLYLPYSREQETNTIIETLRIFNEIKITNFKNEKEISDFIIKIKNLSEKMKNFSNLKNSEIKSKMCLTNRRRKEIIKNEILKEFGSKFKLDKINENNSDVIYFDENDEILKNIIYGDYKNKNENVEIYLHQRTMKKVKYKKREYESIHPIDEKLLEKVIENFDQILN